MVDRQLRLRGIVDERVLAAMGEVPRELFLAPEWREHAYRDGAVAIAEGQTMSQPWIVARMTSLLGLNGDERVLEVGTGSGYGAAVLSRCCAEVVTIERHAALAEQAAGRLAELGYSNVEVRTGDGTLGAPDRAPFGGALVTAVAEERPPPAIAAQLVEGAALVCPVRDQHGEHLMCFRDGRGERVVPVRFVPLVPTPPEGP
jgi:protein-L-isoaspartate(D-aspartate) O-methyltransferase